MKGAMPALASDLCGLHLHFTFSLSKCLCKLFGTLTAFCCIALTYNLWAEMLLQIITTMFLVIHGYDISEKIDSKILELSVGTLISAPMISEDIIIIIKFLKISDIQSYYGTKSLSVCLNTNTKRYPT